MPIQDDLVDAIAQLSFAAMAVLNRIGAENDLSLTQLRVLGILRDRRLRMSDLAEYLGLEKSTLSGLVDRAERRGLLERGRNAADGRAVDVFLSAGGHEVAARLYDEIRQPLRALADALEVTEQRRLQSLLDRILPAPPLHSIDPSPA